MNGGTRKGRGDPADGDTLQVMVGEAVRETLTEVLQTCFGSKGQMNCLEADRAVHLGL